MGTFAGALAAAGALARALDRDPAEFTALDLAALGLATFKAARTISRDDVTSFLREPFVESDAPDGTETPSQPETCGRRSANSSRARAAVGTWVAAGLGTTQLLAPRFGRLLTWTLAAGGLNDLLQAGFAALTHKANELERPTR
jgi:Protein of unknown function (DUF1360)